MDIYYIDVLYIANNKYTVNNNNCIFFCMWSHVHSYVLVDLIIMILYTSYIFSIMLCVHTIYSLIAIVYLCISYISLLITLCTIKYLPSQ